MTEIGQKKKIYLIQFRTDASEKHEQECYWEEFAGRGDVELVSFNVVTGSLPIDIPEDVAGVILGGSGEFFLDEEQVAKYDWIGKTFKFIDFLIEKNIPLLGVCYGGHLMAMQQGADMSADENLKEVGTFKITLLGAAKDDTIFSQLAPEFLGQLGHKRTPVNFPANDIALAKTDRVPCQAFRVTGKPAWGLAFHPELNQDRMRWRLSKFRDYLPKDKTLEEVVAEFQDTPEANRILHLFLDYALQYRS